MSDSRTRVIILVVAVIAVIAVLIAGILVCRSGMLVARSQPTSTPTKTPKPTFTATSTPTNTSIPTNTATPTSTATATPQATNTAIVYTATPTPVPTDTATPIPTPTRVPPTNTPRPRPTKPKPTPTKAPPTNTPVPQYPWKGTPAGTFSNCGLTAWMGLTLDRNGGVAGDVVIHHWTDGWDGAWAVSEWVVNPGYPGEGDEKNWDGLINNRAVDGVWYACVVSQPGSWDCLSDKMVFTSVSTPCEPDSGGVQIMRVVFQQR